MAREDVQMEVWMVRVRLTHDLQSISSLMLGCRGKVGMVVKEDFPTWRKVYVSMAEMEGMVCQAVELALHDRPRPARLAPGRLIQGLKKIQLLAASSYEKAVNPVSNGGYGDYDELLADVVGWTGTENLVQMRRTFEEVLDGVEGATLRSGEGGWGGADPAKGNDGANGTARKT